MRGFSRIDLAFQSAAGMNNRTKHGENIRDLPTSAPPRPKMSSSAQTARGWEKQKADHMIKYKNMQ